MSLFVACAGEARRDFVYVAVLEGDFEILVGTVGDTVTTVVSGDAGLDYWPSWTPNGDRVVYYSNRAGNNDLYSSLPDGSDVRRLTDHPANDLGGVVGPDGRIAFISDRDGNRELYVMEADGSGLRRLTENDHYDSAPAWSPDGSTIAYASSPSEGADIHVVDVASGEIRSLADTGGHDDSPSWSPDGRWIAFNGASAGSVAIYVVSVDGSELRRIDNVAPDERHPRWSPDGTLLLYTSTTGAGADLDSDIWVMHPDGTGRRAVVDSPGRSELAVWRPGG